MRLWVYILVSKGEERSVNMEDCQHGNHLVGKSIACMHLNHVPSPPLARNLPSPEENVRAFTHEL